MGRPDRWLVTRSSNPFTHFQKSRKRNVLPLIFLAGFQQRKGKNNWEKNRKTFFDFLSSGLGINVSLFRLRQFEEVESELGSPVAGVEIGTG